jgi:hypothetical protein
LRGIATDTRRDRRASAGPRPQQAGVQVTGSLIAGPVTDTEEILYAEADPRAVLAARREFDPVGRYARPDVFHLNVDTTPRRPVSFVAADDRPAAPSR